MNYEAAKKCAAGAEESALKTLIREMPHAYSIYSSNSFGGNELVFIAVLGEGSFTDESGEILPAQKTEGGYEVLVKVQPFGAVTVWFRPDADRTEEAAENAVLKMDKNLLDTPYYIINWNEEGQLTRIYDKKTEREILREGQKGNVLEIYEDKPVNYDAWDIDIFYTMLTT